MTALFLTFTLFALPTSVCFILLCRKKITPENTEHMESSSTSLKPAYALSPLILHIFLLAGCTFQVLLSGISSATPPLHAHSSQDCSSSKHIYQSHLFRITDADTRNLLLFFYMETSLPPFNFCSKILNVFWKHIIYKTVTCSCLSMIPISFVLFYYRNNVSTFLDMI